MSRISDPREWDQGSALEGEEMDGDDSDYSSSLPDSEDGSDDETPADIELTQFQSRDYHQPLDVVIRCIEPPPPPVPFPSIFGPVPEEPILEVWGARPFGYEGVSYVWSIFCGEPTDDDIDQVALWADVGIARDPSIIYRGVVQRKLARVPWTGPHAVEVYLYQYDPQTKVIERGGREGPFMLYGTQQVMERKELKRIRRKMGIQDDA